MPDTTIPQIKPENASEESAVSNPAQEASVLETPSSPGSVILPKIDLIKKGSAIESGNTKMKFGDKLKTLFRRTPKEGKPEDGTKEAKNKKILTGVLVFIVFLLVAVFVPGALVYKSANNFYKDAMGFEVALATQDIGQIRSHLDKTTESLSSLNKSYKYISWLKIVPFVGGYVKDGQHVLTATKSGLAAGEILLATAEPYADIIGLTGGESETENGEKTTEERIDFLVATIPELLPKIDELTSEVQIIQNEVSQINPNRYPVKMGGFTIREKLKKGVDMTNQATSYVTSAKPLLEVAPKLLGIEEAQNYLILFQNDKELRPTGGFLTAYSIAKVEKGKFEPVISSDIYDLDAKYTPVNPAPEPIVTYIKGPYILSENMRLRDINWSPDFAVSMEEFVKEAEGVGVTDVDGIIAVDTKLLEYLLDAIGAIGVPGFGNFSTDIAPECNCPQVIYELESFADVEGPIIWDPLTGEIIYRPPNSDNRKKIIGPLMNSVLANSMGAPKEKLPALFKAAFDSITEKHVMLYMFDEKVQSAVVDFGIGGTIDEYEGDYLHINDANLGGRKSNLYVTQEVEQEVEIAKDGSVVKTLTVTYKNPEEHDGWLNSILPNWMRIYVPKGSELIDLAGLDDREEPYEDLGKTVFAGHFELRPQGVAKITVQYKLPFKVVDEYNLLVQKQAGTDKPLHSIIVGKETEELFLFTDKEFRFKL